MAADHPSEIRLTRFEAEVYGCFIAVFLPGTPARYAAGSAASFPGMQEYPGHAVNLGCDVVGE